MNVQKLCEKFLEENLQIDADAAWEKAKPELVRHMPPKKNKTPKRKKRHHGPF